MTETMTIDQIISAAKSDMDRHIDEGSFTGDQGTSDDNQENFYTMESLYCQWAEDEAEASLALWKMFEEEYPEFFADPEKSLK